jgi:NAD(P)-dependent dehydrogenase (short-subunit alcohol dehydrogenase family)
MSPVCLLTGISGGIGQATAGALAERGVQVIGVARDADRGRAAVQRIRDRAPAAQVELMIADLSQLDEVRRLAEEVRLLYDHLDVLLNNAGVAVYRRETTADGYERTFATNHLAPYLLTRLLVDRLEAAEARPARVVCLSSEAHRQARSIPWDDLQSEQSYNGFRAYNLSKLANVLFARALAERLDPAVVVANAVSPGFVHTGLNRGATLPYRLFFTLMRPLQRSPEVGAGTPVWAATDPAATAVTGGYFEKRRPARTNPLVDDRATVERMWTVSAALCGLDP